MSKSACRPTREDTQDEPLGFGQGKEKEKTARPCFSV